MQKKFIIFIALVIIIVAGGGYLLNRTPNQSGKFDQLAQGLKEKGAKFYGAFWCQHCQNQKAQFGSSKKYLPYVECSQPNNSPVAACLDNKIESYPTWTFADGIKLTSQAEPIVCDIKTSGLTESKDCQGKSSSYFKTWFFEDHNFSIKSPSDPKREGNIFLFPKEAQASGELPLPFLAEQINMTLPQ